MRIFVGFNNSGILTTIQTFNDPRAEEPEGLEEITDEKLKTEIKVNEYKKVNGEIVKMDLTEIKDTADNMFSPVN